KADCTINRNLFIMPLKDNLFKIGSTYNWQLEEPIVTVEGKKDMLDRLAAFTSFDYTIIEHKAGIRPTVSDRRPLLGQHKSIKNAFIFNGLGTKGVMIAPYFSEQLFRHACYGDELDVEVDIKRFDK
ncbi:FAD-binding oxidoreductase, partial [Crocinitomix sp.]|nr:FAD-binding oxidoreductase [Crocinitomix sp.]